MLDTTEEEIHSEVPIQRTVLLDIPHRLQWENGHGYCGETAIQSFGMYMYNYSSNFFFNLANFS